MTISATGLQSGSIDYSAWIDKTGGITKPSTTTELSKAENDSVSFKSSKSSSSSEECTDGKDDGKIGFFSAAWNTIKGAGKTLVNGVKGMFTDKEGNFSLGKTLLSAATVAACIAFPAVGVAACVVGGTMGAVQLGKGVYKAATAETDAEAKQAWQDVGGGALTVGMSVAGAKSGMKAVKSTSTAGTNGASALDSLGSNATKMQKISAFGKDMLSSTKNGYTNAKSAVVTKATNIKTNATNKLEAAKIKNLESKVSKIEGAPTSREQSMINELNARKAYATDGVNAELNKPSALGKVKSEAADTVEALKIKNLENKVNKIEGATTSKEQSIINELNARKAFATDSVNTKVENISSFTSKVKDTASNTASKAKNVTSHPIKSIKSAVSKTPEALKSAKSKLSAGGQKVLDAINSTDSTYAQLVQKYGYENVAEVLKVIGGTQLASESV